MKLFLLLFLYINNIFSVELDFKPIFTENTSNKKNIMFRYLKDEKKFTANSKKDVLKFVNDNEIFANIYLDKYFSKDDKALIEIKVDEWLAGKLLEKVEKEIIIGDDILKSYYLNHKKDFQYKPFIDITIFKFDNFQSSFDFYTTVKDKNLTIAQNYAENNSIKYSTFKDHLNSVNPALVAALEKDKEKYFLPPFYIASKFDVIYVNIYDSSIKYIPFNQTKRRIKSILFKKIYYKKRAEIINNYKAKKSND
jgi:hypothetical protein